MDITIFELDWSVYELVTDYLSSSWGEWLAYKVGDTVDVKLSKYAKFTTTGNGVTIEYMGRSALLGRNDYNYIKID